MLQSAGGAGGKMFGRHAQPVREQTRCAPRGTCPTLPAGSARQRREVLAHGPLQAEQQGTAEQP
jgi:hypothetical protein